MKTKNMRRTERAAYRTKFYSNLSSPTRFDEEPKRALDIKGLDIHYCSSCLISAKNFSISGVNSNFSNISGRRK
ncbi:hypothetical protein AUF14_03385 [Enterococcus avium]|nr:hypothetical protein AUF14_03385 [Enterococcus avium]